LVIELLTTTSAQRAVDLARFLEAQNAQRQQHERHILARAREMLNGGDVNGTSALVLADADWHPGIVGIVASRLVDLYGRRVWLRVWGEAGAKTKQTGRASGGSPPASPRQEAPAACSAHGVTPGGHGAAAGLKIQRELIDSSREPFCSSGDRHFASNPLTPR